MNGCHRDRPVRRRTMRCAAGLLSCLLASSAGAQSIEQGLLQLQWGDPAHALPGQARQAPQVRAFLLKDDGSIRALDVAQAQHAAGDLHALANRRVAVSFTAPGRAMSSAPAIEVIVPADRVAQGATAVGASGRAMASAPVVGTTRWVTLMCKFSDIAAEQKALDFFQAQYGDAVGLLGHYWKEVSYNKINLAGSTAHGWYTLPQPRSHYVTKENGKDKADLKKLFADCGAAADATVTFTGVQGINMMFNGDLDGYAWGGQSCAMLEGGNFCTRVTWNPPWSFNNLAPLAHEMGHGYGLPHSDNSDGDDDTYDNPWDVMSDAWSNAVGDATYGARPKHVNIFQRHRLGWVDAARQLVIPYNNTVTRQVNLDFAHIAGSANTQMLVLSLSPQADPYATIVYTVEARKPEGAYEGALAGAAVIIHKLERSGTAYSIDADVPPANKSNNEGSMFKVGERWYTPDERHWVSVDAATATGFRLTVGPKPRVMSQPLPALVRPAAVAAPSSVPGVLQAPAVTPQAAPVQGTRDRCADKRGLSRVLALCRVF